MFPFQSNYGKLLYVYAPKMLIDESTSDNCPCRSGTLPAACERTRQAVSRLRSLSVKVTHRIIKTHIHRLTDTDSQTQTHRQ